MAYKTFANGFPLPASDLNNYLMNQSVIVFASAAERSSTLTSPTEGMITYLEDTDTVEVYNGTAWTDINDNTAAIPKSTVTTAGDLIVADGASSVTRLGIGADTQVLTSDGTTATWETPSYVPAVGSEGQILTVASGVASWEDAAGGGGMTLISTHTLSGLSTLTVTGLPQTYERLMITGRAIGFSATNQFRIRPTKFSDVQYSSFPYVRVNGASGSVQQRNAPMLEIRNIADTGNSEGSFYFIFNNYNQSANITFTGVIGYESSGQGNSELYGGDVDESALTGFRFEASSGTFTNGFVEIWGIV